ncbi:hypothetical protein V6N11_009255 [Hibiscus sabdariffa]|uniref:Uncharacterized protein n=1 Tax=Hibiscus sabdariffa TaxID=183260 RepID=A0ABR2PQ59_9ROSI
MKLSVSYETDSNERSDMVNIISEIYKPLTCSMGSALPTTKAPVRACFCEEAGQIVNEEGLSFSVLTFLWFIFRATLVLRFSKDGKKQRHASSAKEKDKHHRKQQHGCRRRKAKVIPFSLSISHIEVISYSDPGDTMFQFGL